MDIKSDLFALLDNHGITPEPNYRHLLENYLTEHLAYTTPVMVGLVQTLLNNKLMMAYNLIQNAIDEAKGAARIHIIAERYAEGAFKKQMLKHVGDEMKHSRLFANLVRYTGFNCKEEEGDGSEKTIDDIMDFDDDLKTFICRVHSIEIRSWVMLRHYLDVLGQHGDASIRAMIPTFSEILQDEVRHVAYTGMQVNQWFAHDSKMKTLFKGCITHTNRETWHDVASMSQFMAEQIGNIMKAA